MDSYNGNLLMCKVRAEAIVKRFIQIKNKIKKKLFKKLHKKA